MIGLIPDGFRIPVSIPTEHERLHGQLTLLPDPRGLVVLAHAAHPRDVPENVMADLFGQAGLSTLSINLLSPQEERFADVHHNIPLLAKRLLDFLGLLKNKMRLGEIESQPLGLYAAHSTSPVVVRVAALRDHDIAAIVCRGGLIDLAGMLYLRSLESPLLLLIEKTDDRYIASNCRALREIHCIRELKLTHEMGIDSATADEAVHWFIRHFNRS